MTHWLSQITAITYFNLCTIPQRKGAVAAAAIGIAGVVAVFVGVLSIAEGFRKTMADSGSKDVAIVLRSGADTEMNSGLSREETRLIRDSAGVAMGSNGPLASAELFVIINLPKRNTGTDANVPLRGVDEAALPVRGNVKIEKGRAFEAGRNEMMVGVGAAREFAGLDLGKTIRVGQSNWEVVGIFSAEGGVAESEIWTDALVLQSAYARGDSYQSMMVRLTSEGAFHEFKDALTSNPQLKVRVVRQAEFYEEQSKMLTGLITTIGTFIVVLMSLGALFGALNTMYSAVAGRTREIATLRAIGFGSSPVVVSILFESVLVAAVGGAIGGGMAYFAFNGYQTATMNFQTFSQVAFAFAVTPQLLALAILISTVIGLIGGLFPALRAARLPVAAALQV